MVRKGNQKIKTKIYAKIIKEVFTEQVLTNTPFLLFLIAWSMFWKGWALWRAAKNDQRNWFIAILLVNTLGVLEIIYLQWFAKKKTLWQRIQQRIFRQ